MFGCSAHSSAADHSSMTPRKLPTCFCLALPLARRRERSVGTVAMTARDAGPQASHSRVLQAQFGGLSIWHGNFALRSNRGQNPVIDHRLITIGQRVPELKKTRCSHPAPLRHGTGSLAWWVLISITRNRLDS